MQWTSFAEKSPHSGEFLGDVLSDWVKGQEHFKALDTYCRRSSGKGALIRISASSLGDRPARPFLRPLLSPQD